MTLRIILAVFLAFLPAAGGVLAEARAITVFVAASLGPAIASWGEGRGAQLRIVAAGSSALARQIEYGAPADIFVSANTAWMDHLAARGRIDIASRRNLVGNTLVMIAPADTAPRGETPITSAEALTDALGTGRLAVALTEAVPAGIYGKAALQSLGLWAVAAPRLAQTDNVRAALRLVVQGHTPLGIVYGSDVMSEPGVRLAARFAPADHPPIAYPAALLPEASPEARAFYGSLFTPAAGAHFAAYGFGPPGSAP